MPLGGLKTLAETEDTRLIDNLLAAASSVRID